MVSVRFRSQSLVQVIPLAKRRPICHREWGLLIKLDKFGHRSRLVWNKATQWSQFGHRSRLVWNKATQWSQFGHRSRLVWNKATQWSQFGHRSRLVWNKATQWSQFGHMRRLVWNKATSGSQFGHESLKHQIARRWCLLRHLYVHLFVKSLRIIDILVSLVLCV